jgi:hypothetical protein
LRVENRSPGFIAGAFFLSSITALENRKISRHAIAAADGIVYPIDPVVQRIQPDFADFLRENPDRIHNR